MESYQPVPYQSLHSNGFVGSKQILQPLILTIQPRDHVALVGASGSGKSTLLAGLARLLPAGHGQLKLDGWESHLVSLARWRAALLCLPQQPLLLAGTVRHNLDPESVFGMRLRASSSSSSSTMSSNAEENGECADDVALWEALRLAGLEDIVRSSILGLDSEIDLATSRGSSKAQSAISSAAKGKLDKENPSRTLKVQASDTMSEMSISEASPSASPSSPDPGVDIEDSPRVLQLSSGQQRPT